jgi:hypothetical protein
VLRGQPSLLSAAEAWTLVQAASEDVRRTPEERHLKHVAVRLFFDGCRVDRDLATLLPTADDTDVDAYERRIDKTTGRKFFLVINHVQTMDWTLFERVRERASRLASEYGERAVRAAVIVGNDRYSGLGVHFDEGCLQQVQDVIVGRKRAYLWERDALAPQVWARLANTTRIENLDSAVLLEADAGEAVSWPGTCFHLMENLGGCSISATVTYRQETSIDLRRELQLLLADAVSDLSHRHGVHLPDLERVQQDILADVPRTLGETFVSRMVVSRLCAETTSRVEYAPTPRTGTNYMLDDWLVRKPESVIRWITRDRSVMFSSCGHFYEVDDAPDWLPAFLTAVAATTYASVREIAAASRVPESELPVALQVANALRACNALV